MAGWRLPTVCRNASAGEWSFLTGLPGIRARAIHTWAEFAEAVRSYGYCSRESFALIQARAEILILQTVHGCWEIYPSSTALLEQMSTKYSLKFDCRFIDSDQRHPSKRSD
jgi:hypothetical protein